MSELIYRAVLEAAEHCEVLGERVQMQARMHLVVMREPYLSFVTEGTKRVEARFGRTRQPPFEAVYTGDLLLLKKSSGPVVACATVTSAMYFQLDVTPLAVLRERFDSLIGALPDFWDNKHESRFASLFRITAIAALEPFDVPKRDRRGWVVLDRPTTGVQTSLL